MMDKETICKIINYNDEIIKLKKLALEVGLDYCYYINNPIFDICDFNFEKPELEDNYVWITEKSVKIEWSEYSYNENCYYSIEFPTSYLWEDWRKIEDKKKEKAKIEAEKKRVKDEIASEKRRKEIEKLEIEQEKKLYEKLKEKYG